MSYADALWSLSARSLAAVMRYEDHGRSEDRDEALKHLRRMESGLELHKHEISEYVYKKYSATMARIMDRFRVSAPAYRCIFDFMGAGCKYSGPARSCNKTPTRCKELDNFENFGRSPPVRM